MYNIIDFVVQFGIASESEETAKWGTPLEDDPMLVQSNTRGTITYATAGPNTRTTQLFINIGDNAFLDKQGFTPIGTVTSGLDQLQQWITNPTPGSSDGADQSLYEEQGNAWILPHYPNIDIITTTELMES